MIDDQSINGEWDRDHLQYDSRPTKESIRDTHIKPIRLIISKAREKKDESEKVEWIIESIIRNLDTLRIWLLKYINAPGFLAWSKENSELIIALNTLKEDSTDTKSSEQCIAKIIDLLKGYAINASIHIVVNNPEEEHPTEKHIFQKIMNAFIWLYQYLYLLICDRQNNPQPQHTATHQHTQSNLSYRSLLLFKLNIFSNPQHLKSQDPKGTLGFFDKMRNLPPRKDTTPTASTDCDRAVLSMKT